MLKNLTATESRLSTKSPATSAITAASPPCGKRIISFLGKISLVVRTRNRSAILTQKSSLQSGRTRSFRAGTELGLRLGATQRSANCCVTIEKVVPKIADDRHTQEIFMPKLKTHKGAAKRFKKTGTGKIVRRHAFARHILTSKSRSRKRRLGQSRRWPIPPTRPKLIDDSRTEAIALVLKCIAWTERRTCLIRQQHTETSN